MPINDQDTELDKLIQTLETYLGTHRYDIVIDTAQKILAINPLIKNAHLALTYSYNNTGRYDLMKKVCEDALKIWPDEPEFYYMLFHYYLYQGGYQYVTARDIIKKAIELKPEDARYHRLLGEIYLINREPKKAIVHLKKAVELKPDNAEYKSRMALAMIRLGKVSESLDIVNSCLSDEPDDEKVLDNAGMVYILSGELEKAEELFRDALRRFPTYNYFQSHLEWVLREKTNKERVLKQNRKYLPLYITQKGSKRFFDEEK